MRKVKNVFSLPLFLLLAAPGLGQKTVLDSPENIRTFQSFFDMIYNSPIGNNGVYGRSHMKEARRKQILQDQIPPDVPFPCNVTDGRSEMTPDSVDRLRPGDVDVVGCVGDSLVAGSGLFATNILQVTLANRGASFLGGGQATWREFLTIPNILKEFNPNLIGYALGDSNVHDVEKSQFNVATIGAMSRDLPFMTRLLVRRIKADPRVNVDKHWKLISIMMGHNDFCVDICYVPSLETSLRNHSDDVLESLRIIRDNLPRTFVALIPPFCLKNMVDAFIDTYQCFLTRSFECPCLCGISYSSRRKVFYDFIKRWQKLEEEISQYDEFHKEDFTVELQPMGTEALVPRRENGQTDERFLSADCFHLSQRADSVTANALWNNLLQPTDEKQRIVDPKIFRRFLCPTRERPFLATRRNSASNELSRDDRTN